jgi:tetratricopeptide (TPR) repeat protein
LIPHFFCYRPTKAVFLFIFCLISVFYAQKANSQHASGQNVAFSTTEPVVPGSKLFEQNLAIAIDAFYRSDWELAQQGLKELKLSSKPDLRIDFFEAMIPFWSYFFGGNNPADAQRFLDLSESAITTGDRILALNPGDTSTVLMMGGLHGYRSLVAASERRYRTAISSGVSGHSFTRILLTLDNDDPNTLMGQGVFEYMIGSIPREARWIARLAGLSGSTERGFEILEQAAASDSYVSNDASMFLAWFYESDGRYDDAIRHLNALYKRYPQNVIFMYNLARLMEITNRIPDAFLLYEKVKQVANTSLPSIGQLASERLMHLENRL